MAETAFTVHFIVTSIPSIATGLVVRVDDALAGQVSPSGKAIEMAKPALEVSPELIQAHWRLCLNGNPPWGKYYSRPGTRRCSNTRQVSVGYRQHSSGRDTSSEAGRPYFYTTDVVDEYRLGFGFWSRTTRESMTTYRFAAHDIEPMLQEPKKHVDRDPSPQATRVALNAHLDDLRARELKWKRQAADDVQTVVLLAERTTLSVVNAEPEETVVTRTLEPFVKHILEEVLREGGRVVVE